MTDERPTQNDYDRARKLLTQWSNDWGCSVISRYEGDRWDKLVVLIAEALRAQREKFYKQLCFYCRQGNPVDTELNHKVIDDLRAKGTDFRLSRCEAAAIRAGGRP